MAGEQTLATEEQTKLDELTFIYSPNPEVEKNKASAPFLSEHTGPDEYHEEKSNREDVRPSQQNDH
ncbi:hypothetical protein A4V04_02135 [Burkholderiales bacterium YL45]|uniref:Uncharacterized protein n=1 Tax=Turicimonas muris TaxID=1796652 RepID=A0A227KRT2_9BURK|nr:hypothetical protein A4V04_02135 [Burkholderiales bacterium YL45]OXE51158.1 hypothetical protein ADH67_02375 [Turicimonas muris]